MNCKRPQQFTVHSDNSACSTTRSTAERREWPSPMLPALQALPSSTTRVHIVASGDPLLHGIGGTLIRLLRRRKGDGAAACVGGDAGVRPNGVDRARHRGDQPGHRTAAHRGAPRRPGNRAVERPVHTECPDPPAHRARPRRFRGQRARTGRRPRRTPPRRHRAPVGRGRATRRRRPQRDRRPIPARRAHRAIARRRVRPRRADHQTRHPRGDPGGTGAAAGGAVVGCRRGLGQHRRRMVP